MNVADVEPARPALSARDQALGVIFSLWMVIGLFLDGWAHDNNKPETFFTPWHGVLYSGFAAAAGYALYMVWRSRDGGSILQTLPRGHGLTLLALGLFGFGAAGDLVWHEIFGIEVGVEALLSPTHLVLLTSGIIALSAPLRAAWGSASPTTATLRGFLPPLLSLALLTALVGFFVLYLSPFVNDAAGQAFQRVAEAPHDHPSSDPAELRQLVGIASILMTTLLLAVPTHLLLRRWDPPRGSFTLLYTVVVILFVGLDEFRQPLVIVAGLAGGLAADFAAPRLRVAAGASGAAALWITYFAVYEIAEGGVAWAAELWTGTVFLAALIATAVGLVADPPSTGAAGVRSRHAGSHRAIFRSRPSAARSRYRPEEEKCW